MLKSRAFRIVKMAGRPALLFTALVGLAQWGCARDEQDLTSPGDQAPGFAVVGAQPPDLANALAVHGRHTMRLIAISGVVGTAVGVTVDGRPAIKIFTKEPRVAPLPNELEGIPVEVRVTGPLRAMSCSPSTCRNIDVWPTPVPIGVSTGPNAASTCYSGTIGARVKAGSAVYALSNNHVYANENTVPLGTGILQPGLGDSNCSPSGDNTIGTLSAFAPIAFCSGSCPNNTIDAAIAVSDVTRLDNKTPPAGYGTPLSAWWPDTLGGGVQKYGRTTSLTTGQVYGIDATLRIDYATGTAQFVHQIVVSNCPTICIRPGDSGSLLVTNDASAEPVGLEFAGSADGFTAFANPIGDVLTYFGVSVDGNAVRATATGGLTAHGRLGLCTAGAITAVNASGSSAINLTDSCGNAGTMTLSGFTASGGLTAHGSFFCTAGSITAVNASGSNAISLTDSCGNTGTMTLSGANASGGLTAHGGSGLCTAGAITADTASASNWMSLKDTCGNIGYVRLM